MASDAAILRVASWNVHMFMDSSVEALSKEIIDSGADVVCMQESGFHPARSSHAGGAASGRRTCLSAISAATGLSYCASGVSSYGLGQSILSRHPIELAEWFRQASAALKAMAASGSAPLPHILCGDFNTSLAAEHPEAAWAQMHADRDGFLPLKSELLPLLTAPLGDAVPGVPEETGYGYHDSAWQSWAGLLKAAQDDDAASLATDGAKAGAVQAAARLTVRGAMPAPSSPKALAARLRRFASSLSVPQVVPGSHRVLRTRCSDHDIVRTDLVLM